MVGDYTEYHSNEQVFKKCVYNEKGKIDGLYQEYDTNGNLLREAHFENGIEK